MGFAQTWPWAADNIDPMVQGCPAKRVVRKERQRSRSTSSQINAVLLLSEAFVFLLHSGL